MKYLPFKISFIFILCLLVVHSNGQVKLGYISLNELIMAMPESKKVDSSLEEFRQALSQNYDEFQKEFAEQNSLLNSKDTIKYTAAQLEIKRKNLQELYQRLGGFRDEASQQLQRKQQELVGPIQLKAINAIQQVAKENGYTYVFPKDQLYAFPPGDDLLILTKRKLGLK